MVTLLARTRPRGTLPSASLGIGAERATETSFGEASAAKEPQADAGMLLVRWHHIER
jgi:hypothetical protein